MGVQVHVDAKDMDAIFGRVPPIGTSKVGWRIGRGEDQVVYSDYEDELIFDCRCPVRSANAWIRGMLIHHAVPFIEA